MTEHRLFLAIDLPPVVKMAVRERRAGLRESLPDARWASLERSHLTLVFLGDTSDRLMEPLTAEVRECCARSREIEIRLAGVGTFPARRLARVAWVGVEAPAELVELQAGLAEVARRVAQVAPERRDYHPHVTLARCRRAWPRSVADRFVGRGAGEWSTGFTARRVTLFESVLGPDGARHTALVRCALGAEGKRVGAEAEGGNR